jgi:hypothetical protein
VSLQKTIGQARPQIVPSLIVLNSREARLDGGKLTLSGVAANSIVFADRPVRAAGPAQCGYYPYTPCLLGQPQFHRCSKA